MYLTSGDLINIYYACSRNTKRNLFTICLFNNYINATHPMDISGVDLMKVPNNVVIVVSVVIEKNNQRYHALFESKVSNNCRDADIQTGNNKKVDQALKFIQTFH